MKEWGKCFLASLAEGNIMRRKIFSAAIVMAALLTALIAAPQTAEAQYGYRGYRAYDGGYGSGYYYRERVYRPYTTFYRPYRYDGYYRYGGSYVPQYYYYPPTYGPSPYGYPGMMTPPVQINPGVIYRY
jgi:hypothetical protein